MPRCCWRLCQIARRRGAWKAITLSRASPLSRLSAAAKHDIEVLLGAPAADSLATASLWADDVRPVRRETAPWHCVNIELETQGYVAARDCPAGDCVVAQIDRETTILSRRPATRAPHQPLSPLFSISPH